MPALPWGLARFYPLEANEGLGSPGQSAELLGRRTERAAHRLDRLRLLSKGPQLRTYFSLSIIAVT
jgi:hypothetical protein